MRTSVLLIGYNSERWLPKCLSSLAQASAERLQVCFVDNHNNPGLKTLDWSAFDLEVLKTPEPLGFAEANNFGLQHSQLKSDLVVFLNQDTVSTPGWLDQIAVWFGEEPELAVVSPGLRTYDLQDWEPNLLACARESGMAASQLRGNINGLKNVTAAAMVIRQQVLAQVGPFDPVFGSYYEDYDLCRRVRQAGFQIGICSEARVGHFSGSVTSTPAAEHRRTRALVRNRLIHRLRDCADGRSRVLLRHLLVDLPRNLLRGVLRTRSSQPVTSTLAAHWDLIKIADRLVSQRRDAACWNRFLTEFRAAQQLERTT